MFIQNKQENITFFKKASSLTSVLVVDDYDDSADVLTQYLELNGFEISAVGKNGQEAAELYEKLKPDVVLMDLQMPEFDGYYGLEKIRQIDPDSKVIIITGSLSPNTKNKLRDLEVSATLIKPYESKNVIETIEKVLKNDVVSLSNN